MVLKEIVSHKKSASPTKGMLDQNVIKGMSDVIKQAEKMKAEKFHWKSTHLQTHLNVCLKLINTTYLYVYMYVCPCDRC